MKEWREISFRSEVFMKIVHIVAFVLLLIGGLNWGLVGAFDMDVVASIFGAGSHLARAVYIAIGLSAIFAIVHCRFKVGCGCCKE